MFKIESIRLICDGEKERFLDFSNVVSYVYAPNCSHKVQLLQNCEEF